MTYQVLARKWRPQDFSGLVGQDPIVTALRNGLTDNRIAQAYLFSGIRGVGKTTAARVLAKALNCERGPAPDRPAGNPCNECAPCTQITAGADLDVIEVDAATYSKVEQIRELTESLRYGPARDRYKVVVLDEVHRLSRQAFDALLKIVEEPPAHLVFIFATTEIDSVPATILSRCQEFQFRRVPSPVMAAHLRRISDAEKIEVSDAALRLLSRAGEGSVRDSVALLDQLATFGNGKISDRDAADLLGGLDAAIFLGLLRAIVDGEPMAITEVVREIEANGWDPHNVYAQFLVYVRDGLHLAMGSAPKGIDLPLEEAEALASLVRPRGYENLLRLTHHLLVSEPIVRRSEFGLLALQVAWLRAAELPKLTRIEDILRGSRGKDTAEPDAPSNPSTETTIGASVRQAHQSSPAGPSNESLTSDDKRLSLLHESLAARRQPLAALFNSAELAFEDGRLQIRPQAGDTLLENALGRGGNAALVEDVLKDLWGDGTGWVLHDPREMKDTAGKNDLMEEVAESGRPQSQVTINHGAKDAAVDGRPADDKAMRKAQEHPVVQLVRDIFGGTIQSAINVENLA